MERWDDLAIILILRGILDENLVDALFMDMNMIAKCIKWCG